MIFLLLVKYFFLLCYKKFSFEFGLYGEQKFKWIKFCGKIFFCIRMNRYKRETWNETVLHSFIFFDKKAKQKFCLFDFLKRKILLLFDFIGSFFFSRAYFLKLLLLVAASLYCQPPLLMWCYLETKVDFFRNDSAYSLWLFMFCWLIGSIIAHTTQEVFCRVK